MVYVLRAHPNRKRVHMYIIVFGQNAAWLVRVAVWSAMSFSICSLVFFPIVGGYYLAVVFVIVGKFFELF